MTTSRPWRRRLQRRCAAVACLVLAVVPAAQAACLATLAGANVAGGEFNAGKQPGTYARDYIFPAAAEIALLRRLDLRLMRVPVLWERLQRRPFAALDADELARLDRVVSDASEAGLTVIIDLHNYGAYGGVSLNRDPALRDALPDVWKRIAQHYASNASVVFGLMNEPKDIPSEPWAAIARATLASIRSVAARNVVSIPGSHWDGAHSWFDGDARSSAATLLPLAKGDDRVVFEVHQYFDADYSGTTPTCPAASQAVASLERVGSWAKANRVRLLLGEFGVSERPECVKALDDALAVVEKNSMAWYGWTYWAAGAWWGDYPFNIQKADRETPQAGVLRERAAALDRTACQTTR